jgi:hypothetical protein
MITRDELGDGEMLAIISVIVGVLLLVLLSATIGMMD